MAGAQQPAFRDLLLLLLLLLLLFLLLLLQALAGTKRVFEAESILKIPQQNPESL